MESLCPSKTEIGKGFRTFNEPTCARGAFIRSEEFDNDIIVTSTVPYIMNKKSQKWSFFSDDEYVRQKQLQYLIARISDHIKVEGSYQFERLSVKASNQSKVGIVNIGPTLETTPVQLYKVGYFDSLMTNEAFASTIHILRRPYYDNEENPIDLTTNFPMHIACSDGHCKATLDSLGDAHVANHVGVTTLIVTKDRKVVPFRQSTTLGDAGAILLGGSGALDYGDICSTPEPGNLISLVRTGMAREACEESGLPLHWRSRHKTLRGVVSSTLVTGYFRWVDRCGKPEFIGVTYMDAVSADLIGDNIETHRYWYPVAIDEFENVFTATRPLVTHMAEDNKKFALSSYVALRRLLEIASYSDSNDPTKQNIHDRVRTHLHLDSAPITRSRAH